MIFVCHAR